MARNHMKQVAKILGVGLREEFQIVNGGGEIVSNYGDNNIFKIGEDGLYSKAETAKQFAIHIQDDTTLVCLLNGRCSIKKKVQDND